MGKICSVKALIKGIYKWGDGFVSDEVFQAYYSFWRRYIPDSETYHVGIHDGTFGNSIYLYGLYGGLNVHPMEITGILETSNSAEMEQFQFQLEHLDEILRDLCAYMKKCADVTVSYEILYAVIDTPAKLRDTEKKEYKKGA